MYVYINYKDTEVEYEYKGVKARLRYIWNGYWDAIENLNLENEDTQKMLVDAEKFCQFIETEDGMIFNCETDYVPSRIVKNL